MNENLKVVLLTSVGVALGALMFFGFQMGYSYLMAKKDEKPLDTTNTAPAANNAASMLRKVA
jgi:hypothetical protein